MNISLCELQRISLVFQAGVCMFRIIDGVRPFHSSQCPWQLAMDIFRFKVFYFQRPVVCQTIPKEKKKKSGNSIHMKEKRLSFSHQALFFSIYVNREVFEFLMWLNPKDCCQKIARGCVLFTQVIWYQEGQHAYPDLVLLICLEDNQETVHLKDIRISFPKVILDESTYPFWMRLKKQYCN